MKRLFSVILTAVLIFSLASCSGRGEDKQIFYALSASPSTLDPQYAKESDAQLIINNTFEGLVRLSADGEVIPGLAETWEISSDGLQYTFHLKPGTEWYCPISLKNEFGEEFYKKFSAETVTSADFVFAMKRAVSPQTGSRYAHVLFPIENAYEIYSGALGVDSLGVYAPDENTLVIKLHEACPDLLERLTESVFMPCNEEFFNAMNGRYGLSNKHILCNGPFYVSSWDSESSLTIKRNKFYSGSQTVVPSSVSFSFDSDYDSVAKKIAAGNLSAALLPPDCATPENSVTVKEAANSVFGFFFNCSDKYLKNKNLRLALCSSVNRELFAETDNAKPMSGFIPESCSAGGKNYREAAGSQTPSIEYNTSSASALWQQALTELETDKITLTVLCPEWLDSAVRRQLQIWQQTMGIGIAVTVVNKTSDEILSAVEAGNYQIALTGVESPYESAVDFLASFEGGEIFRFPSEEYDMIIGRLLESEGDDELLGGCYTAETYILQQAVCFPLYSRSSRFVTAEDIEGITVAGSENTVSFIGAKRFD